MSESGKQFIYCGDKVVILYANGECWTYEPNSATWEHKQGPQEVICV